LKVQHSNQTMRGEKENPRKDREILLGGSQQIELVAAGLGRGLQAFPENESKIRRGFNFAGGKIKSNSIV